MTVLADLIPDAKALSRADKLRLIRLLADDLTIAEAVDAAIPADQSYDAAVVLLRTLSAEIRP